MIALMLGLVIVAAMGQLYSGTSQATRISDALSRLNESGRFAVDFLSSDIRMAGYLSCGAPVRGFTYLRTTVDSDAAASGEKWLYELNRIEGFAIHGFDNDVPSSLSGFDDMLDGTDAIIIRRALSDPEIDIAVQSADATSLTLTPSGHGFQPGEVLVVSSPACDQTSVFQVTGTTTDSVAHSDSSTVVPGNCTSRLFGDLDCPNLLAINKTHKAGASVSRYTVHGYYIRGGDPPALMRIRLTYPGDPMAESGTPYVKEELLPGVENLQVLYGVKSGNDASLIVDTYMTADQIEASSDVKWRDVLSVRFALLIRSREGNVRSDEAGQSYDLLDMLDEPFEPSDRHLRKTFGGVVALRNTVP